MSNRLNRLITQSEKKRNGEEVQEEAKQLDNSTAAGSTIKKTAKFGNQSLVQQEDI